MQEQDLEYMKMALDEAQIAESEGEVPVGAIVVHQGEVIARGKNQKESKTCATRHAEIEALEAASEALGRWRLEDCTLYVTLEPCVMCAGALVAARLDRVVYGATDPKGGGVRSLYEILQDERLNHRCEVTGGVLSDECGAVLTTFFRNKR